MSNLRKAREIRSVVTSQYSELRDGRITIREVIENPEDYEIGRCDLYDVLIHVPKLGKAGIRKILHRGRIWPHMRVVDLTEQQRHYIITHLPPRAR